MPTTTQTCILVLDDSDDPYPIIAIQAQVSGDNRLIYYDLAYTLWVPYGDKDFRFPLMIPKQDKRSFLRLRGSDNVYVGKPDSIKGLEDLHRRFPLQHWNLYSHLLRYEPDHRGT